MQNPQRHNRPVNQMPTQQFQHQQPPIQQQPPASLPPPQSQQAQQAVPTAYPTPNYSQLPPYTYIAQYSNAYYPQPWPATPNIYQQPTPQHPISQTIPQKPKADLPQREKRIATLQNPVTKEFVLLGKNQTTQSTATNDTKTVNTAAGQPNTTIATTSTKTVTITAPVTTVASQTNSTTTSNQFTTSTVKSSPSAQTTTAQAKPLTTKVNDQNDDSSSPKQKSTPAKSASPTVKATIDKPDSHAAASSLAVQNEFACKASERLAGLSSVESDVDNKKTKDKKVIVEEKPAEVDDDAKIKENVSDSDITTDQSKLDVVNDKPIDKSDAEDKVVEDQEKKATITSDDSNEENVDKSNQSDEGATLHYEPGQYNPKTKSGKKKYDKKFLMAIYDIVSKEPMENDFLYVKSTAGLPDFVPAFLRGANQGIDARSSDPLIRQNNTNYGGRSSDRQERQKRIITTSSLGQEPELKTVSNPWKPSSVVKDEVKVDDAVADIENLKKQFRSLLNKLTPNNFDTLAEKVTKIGIDTEQKLGDVIDIIFAKALSEPGYSVLYGQMCRHLQKISFGKAEFGNILLKRCQNQFHSDIYSGIDLVGRRKKIDEEEDPAKKKHLEEELYEDMYRCRMRGLGLIKFIGELYKIEMLNDAIMFFCIDRLFLETTDESVECLCDLLATIGEKLDKSSKGDEKRKNQNKKNQGSKWKGGQTVASVVAGTAPPQQQTLDPIFEKLQSIRKNEKNALSTRIRFKLLDICELRDKDNWQSKKTKDNNPKKIEEIREAHLEKLKQEDKQNAAALRRGQDNRRLGHASGSSNQVSSLGNNQSGNRMHMSASSHSIRDHQTNDQPRVNFDKDRETGIASLRRLAINSGNTESLKPAFAGRKS